MVKTAVQRNPSKDNQAEIKAKTEAGLQENLQDQLDQELLNLSVTRDLSISDYFVGYLNKQPSLERAIEEVSVRLTAEEVEELMQALALQLSLPKPNGARQAPRGDLMTK
jgi:DNA-directed RNA polymerase specialized sigma54-like protein